MDHILSNPEAEMSVIGAMMQGAACDLTADDFTDKDLRAVFKAIQRQRADKAPTDMVTLNSATSGAYTQTLIQALRAAAPSLAQHHASLVRECSVRRRASDIARALYNDMNQRLSDPDSTIESTRKKLLDLMGGQRQEWTSAEDLAKATYTWLEQLSKGEIKPVGTGINDLDALIGGFYPGELTIIGAKPGTGKTVFGMVMALEAARKGRKVGVMNLEMLDAQYGSRIFSNLGQVNAMSLRKGAISQEEWQQIAQAAGELTKLPAAFLFNSRYLEDLIAAVRTKELDLLVVDYMQLVQTRQKFESERLRMGHISWALKELAIEMRIPVVAMSQLRRPDVGAADKMPSMRDLRESGNLEADADGIILLHQPESVKDNYVYPPDRENFEIWKKKGLRYIAMKVEKQRQGSVGVVSVLFEGARMRYLEIERRQ